MLRNTALLVGMLLLPMAARAESPGTQTHVVYTGQRLGSIAKRYGVTVDALCTANDLRASAALKPGQRLVIPDRADRDGSRARVAAGHDGSRRRSSSERNERSESERPAAPLTHRVESGQRLESIARRYGVKVEALRAYNGIGPKALLGVGQVLRIPDKNATAESAAAALSSGPRSYLRAPERPGFVELFNYSERFRGRVFDKKGRVLPAALSGVSRVLATTSGRPKLDPRLVRLLVDVSDTFGGRPLRIVSGFRTTSFYKDSRHKQSQAVDFSIPGVPNQAVRDYLRTLNKVGVGYYPNSSFVHLDVREYSAYWVDYAGPGEAPRGKHRETHDADDVHEEEPADVPDSTDGAPGALPTQPDAEVGAPKSPDAHAELARGSRPAQ
jgi:LysM repeat protein